MVILVPRSIRSVDGDRFIWPHILDEVTRALPPYTWLMDVQPVLGSAVADPADTAATAPPAGVQMVGRTMDIQGMTRFMRQLEDSPWLRDVAVLSTETVVDRGRAVTAFTVRALYTQAPAEFVRTAPVLPERGR